VNAHRQRRKRIDVARAQVLARAIELGRVASANGDVRAARTKDARKLESEAARCPRNEHNAAGQ
jgi:hypothetical protein